MAYLIQLSNSTQPIQCYNCTFDTEKLRVCTEPNENNCSNDIVYNNSKSGNPALALHHFIAHWINPTPTHSLSQVICALAHSGITQWVHTATLIVNPTLTVTEKPPVKATVVPALSSLVVIVGVVIVVLVFIIWYRHRNRTKASKPLELHLDEGTLTIILYIILTLILHILLYNIHSSID